MCPVESPPGVERPALAGLSRTAACRLIGVSPSALGRWERSVASGVSLPASLAFADLLALAVLRELTARLGAGADDFSAGVAQLFAVLAARADLERLDDYVALIGHDFARLAELRSDHVRCVGDDFIVVALHPILASFRDQVFA
jgi:hypothetical protein